METNALFSNINFRFLMIGPKVLAAVLEAYFEEYFLKGDFA